MNDINMAILNLKLKAGEFGRMEIIEKVSENESRGRYCEHMVYILNFLAWLINNESANNERWIFTKSDLLAIRRFEAQCIREAESIFMKYCCNIPKFLHADPGIIQIIDDNEKSKIFSNEFILFLLNKMERKPQEDRFEL